MEPIVVRLRPTVGARITAVAAVTLSLLLLTMAVAPDDGTMRVTWATRSFMAGAGIVMLGVGAWVWRRAAGTVELTAGDVTIRHPSLSRPLRVPVRAVTGVLVGAAVDIGRPTTLPRSTLPAGATLVISLDDAIEVPTIFTGRQRSVHAIALAAADPEQAGRDLWPLRVNLAPSATAAGQRRHRIPTVHKRLAAALAALPALVIIVGVKTGLRTAIFAAHPPRTADAATETEGRSLLAPIPELPRAVTFRTTAADGTRLYAWQTGDRLRVRVDTSAHQCSGGDWREWWQTTDRRGLALAANGAFHDRHHEVTPVAVGGVDVVDVTVEGRVRGRILTVAFHRRDDYRGAYYNGTCLRDERFSARRSG